MLLTSPGSDRPRATPALQDGSGRRGTGDEGHRAVTASPAWGRWRCVGRAVSRAGPASLPGVRAESAGQGRGQEKSGRHLPGLWGWPFPLAGAERKPRGGRARLSALGEPGLADSSTARPEPEATRCPWPSGEPQPLPARLRPLTPASPPWPPAAHPSAGSEAAGTAGRGAGRAGRAAAGPAGQRGEPGGAAQGGPGGPPGAGRRGQREGRAAALQCRAAGRRPTRRARQGQVRRPSPDGYGGPSWPQGTPRCGGDPGARQDRSGGGGRVRLAVPGPQPSIRSQCWPRGARPGCRRTCPRPQESPSSRQDRPQGASGAWPGAGEQRGAQGPQEGPTWEGRPGGSAALTGAAEVPGWRWTSGLWA